MLTSSYKKEFVDGDRPGSDFSYYRGVLKRGRKIVWECESGAWQHHETPSEAVECAEKVLRLVEAEVALRA